MIKHIATASCMTIMLASCDFFEPQVDNTAPVAKITTQGDVNTQDSVSTGTEPLTVTFDSSTSTDDKKISSVTWEIDGVNYGSNTSLNHTFEEAGEYKVTVFITDDENVTSKKETIVIVEAAPENRAPVIGNMSSSQIVKAGDNFTLNASASDADNDVLTYNWNVLGNNYANGQSITTSLSTVGVHNATLTVSDGEASVESTIEISVIINTHPVVSVGEDITIYEGEVFSLSGSAVDADYDNLTSSWKINNLTYPGNTVSPSVINTAGEYAAIFTVSDGSATESKTINVTVIEVPNTLPVLTVGSDITVTEGGSFNLMGSASDADGDVLTGSWEVNNLTYAGNSVSPEAILTPGTYSAIYTVNDGTDTVTKTLSIIVTPDTAPVLTVGVDITVYEGASFTLSGSAFDADGDLVTASWNINDKVYPGNTVLPDPINSVGEYNATYTVTSGVATVTKLMVVTVIEVPNRLPIVFLGADQTIIRDEVFNLAAIVSDQDNDPLESSWTINNQTYLGNSVSPDSISVIGEYPAVFTVDDGTDVVTQEILVTVVNSLPVVSAGANISVNVDDVIVLSGSATDADNDLLTSSWSFNGQTYSGNEITPDSISVAGVYIATFTVNDGIDEVIKEILVTVNIIDLSNEAPIINAGNDISALEGISFVLSGSATDADNDSLTYSWTVDGQTFPLHATYVSISTAGSYIATLSVTDGKTTVTESIVVTITVPVPDDESYTPIASSIPSQYSVSTIQGCGVNTAVINDEFVVIGDIVLDGADGWSHINSTTGVWAGLTKQVADYSIGQTGYNASDSTCNNKDTYNAVLVKKLHDWDQTHANGFKYAIDASNPSFAEMDTITLDLYYDASDSSIPTKAQITSAYSSHITTAEITALDGNGDFQLYIQLDVDLPNPNSSPTVDYDTEGDVHATINLNLQAGHANRWLRLEIPVETLIYRKEIANHGFETLAYESVKDLQPAVVSFVAESISRATVRHLLADEIKYDQTEFDNLNLTKLFKEQSFRIKQLSISKSENNGGGTNTAPTVSLGSNKTVDEGDSVFFAAAVYDADAAPLTYIWKLHNVQVSTSITYSYTFNTANTYVVSLSVNDGSVTTTDSINVTVEAQGTACPSSGTPVAMYGDLYTDGNKLKGCGAQNVQLRGMSMFWSQWSSKYYNRNVVDTLVDDWKVNVVRAAMGVDESDGYLTGAAGKAAELANVEAMIDAAIARGIYVIIDWHTHHGEDGSIKAGAIAFFEDIARRYGNHPNIIYEIYNEPLNVSWNSVLKPYALDVVAAIRAIDPDNLIIMGTQTWSQEVDDAGRNPITNYPNIAYTVHFYACTHKDSIRAKVQSAINDNVVVFATEWGMSQANGGTYGTYPNTTNDNTICISETNKWLKLFDDNNISWLNWSLMDKDESSSALKPGASSTGNWNVNTNLSPSGKWLRDRLRSY
ncbi:MAG: PKD domain-containing protein [Pseudomonadales bacterium]|nr:PKD domain-containing protein [Pseudomonadales bacterium]